MSSVTREPLSDAQLRQIIEQAGEATLTTEDDLVNCDIVQHGDGLDDTLGDCSLCEYRRSIPPPSGQAMAEEILRLRRTVFNVCEALTTAADEYPADSLRTVMHHQADRLAGLIARAE